MGFLSVILNNLLRRKSRSLLTVAGLAVAVAATTSLLSVAWGYRESANGRYSSCDVDIVVVRAGVAERITSSLRAGLADRLRAVPEVAAVDGSLTEMVSLGGNSLIGIPLHGHSTTGFTMDQFSVTRGRRLEPGDRHALLVGEGLAQSLPVAPGEHVDVEGVKFQVVGVFRGGDALQSNTAVATLNDLQELMDRLGQVSEFQIQAAKSAADPAGVRRLCQAIESLADAGGNPLGLKAMPAHDFVASDTEIGLLSGMAWGTSAVAIFLSTVGVLNTMLMSVLERTRDLGILRALGWSRLMVVRLILGESLLVCAAGSAAGITAAWACIHGLAACSFTSNLVQPGLVPASMAAGAAVGLLAGVAGALYPAYRATTVDPTVALRYE